MTRGRHARPSRTARNLKLAAITGFAAATPVTFATMASADPTVAPEPEAAPTPEAATLTHVVIPGDTLYGIAVDGGICTPELDPETCWQPLYEQNRDVIGVNPNLIFPGQTLSYVGGLLLPGGAPVEGAQEQVTSEIQTGASAIIANSYGPVTYQAQHGADAVFNSVPGASLITIGGTRASAIDPHGHPSGKALDFMVLGDTRLGDAIAQFNIDHWDELGIEYVIWQQQIKTSPGGAWQPMEDRGSPTQNHMDHVHVNYR